MAEGVPSTERTPQLLAARPLDVRRAPRVGLIAGVAVIFVAAVGMLEAFSERTLIDPGVSVTNALVFLIAVGAGVIAGRPPAQLQGYERSRPGTDNVVAGAIAGASAAVVLDLFVLVFVNVEIRRIFVQFTVGLEELLTFGRGTGVALVLWLVWGTVLGAVGGAYHVLPERARRAASVAAIWVIAFGLLQALFGQLLRGIKLSAVADLLYQGSAGGLEFGGAVFIAVVAGAIAVFGRGGVGKTVVRYEGLPRQQQRMAVLAVMVVVAFALAALPQVLGVFLSAVLGTAGSFLLMALGLNIVIGFAGLLDLGYVAFFAVGAYTTAVLTSTSAPGPQPELIFWVAIPFVVMAAAIAGLVVGTPVLRMRGDYLAIVTLGFGEIARLIVQSDWQRETLGGAQGIRNIPPISIGGLDFVEPQTFFYLILAFAVLFTYVTWALQRSRIGRAWNAMREDEPVAEAMGVNIVAAKLWAFVLGAIMASLGGALFSTKIGSVFPHSFNIIVSITIVVIVIVGGMGSVAGVVVGALVLVGLPEILREFDEFKFLLYGILLIFMMLKRPEGFIPSRRRQRELATEERSQDAWLRAEDTGPTTEPEVH